MTEMRLLVLFALGACGTAAADPALAPAPDVELLHAVPAVIRVSSQVVNPAIKPEHLVDGSMQTAWNSVTGELVGAWFEVIVVPHDAVLREFRMTVGHTGKGPKHEDWFTMNARIKRVTILVEGKEIATRTLDIADRGLQKIPLPDIAGGSRVRVRVDEIEPGSRTDWKETCISELEVWGHAAAATHSTPMVEVAPATSHAWAVDESPMCDHMMTSLRRRYQIEIAHGGSGRGIPTCDETVANDYPTVHLSVLRIAEDKVAGPVHCRFAMDASESWVGPEMTCPLKVLETHVNTVKGGHTMAFEITYTEGDGGKEIVACEPGRPGQAPVCIKPVALAGKGWSVTGKFVHDQLVLSPESGAPPPGVVGDHELVFDVTFDPAPEL